MRRDEGTTPEDLGRPDGNSLKDNYKKHDVGHAETIERLQKLDCEVVEWGIDRRDDDGSDGIIYDDKMDFKIYATTEGGADLEGGEDSEVFHNGRLVGLLDVKTKGSPRYMGRFNERHYVKYYEHAQEFDVPVFVAMFQVHYNRETVYASFVFELGKNDLYEDVLTSSDSKAVSNFPDGNGAVLIPHKHRKDWAYLEMTIEQEKYANKMEAENE